MAAHMDPKVKARWLTALRSGPVEFAPVSGYLPNIEYVGRHRLREDRTPAVEQTVLFPAHGELPKQITVARVVRWVRRNLTAPRITVLTATASLFVGTGLGWWLS
jgi:hypothetical protein